MIITSTYQRLIEELKPYEEMINSAKVMKLEINAGPLKGSETETAVVLVMREFQIKKQ